MGSACGGSRKAGQHAGSKLVKLSKRSNQASNRESNADDSNNQADSFNDGRSPPNLEGPENDGHEPQSSHLANRNDFDKDEEWVWGVVWT